MLVIACYATDEGGELSVRAVNGLGMLKICPCVILPPNLFCYCFEHMPFNMLLPSWIHSVIFLPMNSILIFPCPRNCVTFTERERPVFLDIHHCITQYFVKGFEWLVIDPCPGGGVCAGLENSKLSARIGWRVAYKDFVVVAKTTSYIAGKDHFRSWKLHHKRPA